MSYAIHTADNADFHLIRTCKSVVPGGNILLGMESSEDSDHFNKEYMKGLGKLSGVKVEQLLATKEEDVYAQGIIDKQNIAANPWQHSPPHLYGKTLSQCFHFSANVTFRMCLVVMSMQTAL